MRSMKVRDVAGLAAVLLQKCELLNTGVFEAEQTDAQAQETVDTNRELGLLVRCVNLAAKEIACDYLPLTHTQKIVCTDGVVPYAVFEKPLLEIKSWKNLKGAGMSYFTFSDRVEVRPGEYEVSYTFVPENKEFFDELDFGGTKITDRVLAYGAAAEFCLISGLYDDALIWERRYKDALTVAARRTETTFLPRRRWG